MTNNKPENVEEIIYQLIIDYASSHPHRNWMYEVCKLKDKDKARDENLKHWRELASAITERLKKG